nr:hypothetical protein Iba_chr09bCG13040 [Ipomoea batatas]
MQSNDQVQDKNTQLKTMKERKKLFSPTNTNQWNCNREIENLSKVSTSTPSQSKSSACGTADASAAKHATLLPFLKILLVPFTLPLLGSPQMDDFNKMALFPPLGMAMAEGIAEIALLWDKKMG